MPSVRLIGTNIFGVIDAKIFKTKVTFTPKMEELYYCAMMLCILQTTQHHVPDDCNL
jgi:hypothetical protein